MPKGYVRRTSKKGSEDSISIQAQIERVKEKGCTEFYIDDGKSASLSDENITYEVTDKHFIVKYDINIRPSFKQMLTDIIKKQIPDNKIIVWKWDRFSRHPAFMINIVDFIKKLGVIVEATDDSNEELIRGLLAFLGREEISKMSSRQQLANGFKFNHGIYCGKQRKLGYEWQKIKIEGRPYKTLIPRDSDDLEVLMIRDILINKLGYKEVCQKYNIDPQTYYNIQKDQFYKGNLTYKGQTKKGIHQLLI